LELNELLSPRTAGDLQQAAVKALAAMGEDTVPQSLLRAWVSFSPQTRTTALDALLSREPWAFALLERIRAGDAIALDVSQRARVLKHSSKRVREMAAAAFTSTGSRAQVIEQFQPALQLVGDAGRGRAIFASACITCHQDGETGVEVGPDLKSVANHPPEKLLANILDPSADVQPGYHAYQCELTDGSELYGLITAETGNSLTFKTADGRSRVVLRTTIKSLGSANTSLMPDGLEAGMTPQDLADLIQFVRTIATAR
ncbi:MAG TPA: c-type cytochrome, partial [Verrucomicrobiae bacterium]|nr:c-type cytochrome [Verrucomicrobiae bacterium]